MNKLDRIVSVIFFTFNFIVLWAMTQTKTEDMTIVLIYLFLAFYVSIALFAKSRRKMDLTNKT